MSETSELTAPGEQAAHQKGGWEDLAGASFGDRTERISIYLETRRSEIPHWKHWLRHGEFERLQVVAQTMRQHATVMELPDLETLGSELHDAAKSWDARQAGLQLTRLENYFANPGLIHEETETQVEE